MGSPYTVIGLPLSLHMATNSTTKNLIEGLTFDDVLLVPAYSEMLPRDVDIRTKLTKDITLQIPMVSAAMDTVTEASLAIALAREGGIGILHKNMSAAAQAAEVAKVKRFESGVLRDPRRTWLRVAIGVYRAVGLALSGRRRGWEAGPSRCCRPRHPGRERRR